MLSRHAARRLPLSLVRHTPPAASSSAAVVPPTLAHLRTRRWAHHTPAGPALNPVTEQDIAHFTTILPATSILTTLPPVSVPAEELRIYNDDWMNKYHGTATTVLKPRTTEEVSRVVRWCNERKIGIVPQGGNTGLVGGGVPVKNELVLSLANMTNIRSFDPVSGEHGSHNVVRNVSEI